MLSWQPCTSNNLQSAHCSLLFFLPFFSFFRSFLDGKNRFLSFSPVRFYTIRKIIVTTETDRSHECITFVFLLFVLLSATMA
jgi:hypothetical protein